jgi:hypothetical protein
MKHIGWLMLFLLGCGAESGVVLTKDLVDLFAADSIGDAGPAETRVTPDLVEPEFLPQDLPQIDGFLECLPGDGCFGEFCDDGDDCLSGICVDHLGNSVCSQSCITECPHGWACEPTQMGGSDLVYVCVSRVGVLCRPCANNSDCVSVTGQENICVDYGSGGRFCGASCELASDCPEGYDCEDTSATGDGEVFQCVNLTGECDCAQKSVELALQTVCDSQNEYGNCPGKRICAASGLTGCDALQPAPDTCDGIDNNCDGDVDEATCDDGNPCTEDSCNGADGCTNEPLDEGSCDDGDLCTVTDHCAAGLCVGTAIQCDDSNPCTTDLCDGTEGCLFENNNEICDDGDACTIGDLCVDGSCSGTAVECQCKEDSDCGELEDGDLCNGTLFCDKSGIQFLCQVKPTSVVECPVAPGKDGACLEPVCTPATGKCGFVPLNEGFACDDKDTCTYGSTCVAGECVGGTPLNCSDENGCTADSCLPGAGCQHTPVAGSCSDGDACTFPDVCGDGICLSGLALECDDGNACTADTCSPAEGCKHGPLDGACDDGNVCTTGDKCQTGFCVPTGIKACDDGNPCTNDSCSPEVGCLQEFNGAPCSDDNLCTVNDSCGGGECTGGVPLDCDDGNPCTNDSCNPLVGCLHATNAGECDDSDPCTVGDSCSGGACVGALPLECDDGNPCTNDVCLPMAGCSQTNNQNPCNDGSKCTIDDKCSLGSCIPGAAVSCHDGNPCTDDSCHPQEGCVHADNQEECDDSNACTTGDICAVGICLGEGSLECDDSNPCTKDICLPGGGCLYENIDAACSDSNPCTQNDFCSDGLCQAGLQKECDDANPCTDDACDDTGACVHTGNDAGCDDGNPCTVGDHCSGSKCVPTGAEDCNDDNVCTTDYCHPITGCTHELNSAPCDDGSACTVKDLCELGECKGTVSLNCNDGNVCTNDGCDPESGCVYVANDTACDDGNLCTTTDVCIGGFCNGSGAKDCNDSNVCTDDSCDPDEGCVNTANAAPCDDSNACTTTDVCADKQCAGGGAPDCNDSNVCTDDSCIPASGCAHANNVEGCNDSNACTTTDVCSGGTCTGSGSLTCNDNDPCTDDSCSPNSGCVYSPNAQCCTPSGGRASFNSLSQDSAGGCWNDNICGVTNYSWSGGQAFSAFGQSITCSGGSTCVQHVGVTTYAGSTTVCQGKWDVYCDNSKKCTIATLGKTCTGSSLSNSCNCKFAKATKCSNIKLVAISDGNGTSGCCGGSQPDSMITAVSSW